MLPTDDSHPAPPSSTDASSTPLSRSTLLVLVIGSLVLALWIWRTTQWDPKVPYLSNQPGAQWIVYPMLTNLGSRKPMPLRADFDRTFAVENPPTDAVLELQAFRVARVLLNNHPISPVSPPGTWRDKVRYQLASALQTGENVLRIEVTSDFGPPALWATLSVGSKKITTDEQWQVTLAGATSQKAKLARDPLLAASHAEPLLSPLDALRQRWASLVPLAALAIAFAVALQRWIDQPTGNAFVFGWLGIIALSWVVLFWHNHSYLQANYGFDVAGHLEYIQFIQDRGSLPLAPDGWEMFQPPLYYLLAASLLSAIGTTAVTQEGLAIFCIFNTAIGLVQLSALLACFRLLFPERYAVQSVALLIAGFLPAHLYIFQYVSNEGLVASLSTVTVWLALRIMSRPDPRLLNFIPFGMVAGLALLAKLTAVVVIVPLLGILFGKAILSRSHRPTLLGGLGIAALLISAISGWHYGRVWYHLGTPFVANWDPESGFAWWQQPGFHTSQSLIRFGAVFQDPYLAGVHGLLDGIYSTLWGDGGIGGSTELWSRPPWSYQLMSIGYLLAIVPSLLCLLGLAWVVVTLIRAPSAERFLLLGLAASVSFAILQMNLRLPYYSLAKGFFGLGAAVSLCSFVAIAYDRLRTGFSWTGHGCAVLLAIWGGCAYASFWVVPSSPETLRSMATGYLNRKDPGPRPSELLTELVKISPRDGHAWTLLAMEAAKGGNLQEAEARLRQAIAIDAEDAGALVGLAILASSQGKPDVALPLTLEAAKLEPDYLTAWALLGQLYRTAAQHPEAIAAYREALRIEPYDAGSHAALGFLYMEQGDPVRSFDHLKYAVPLDPQNAELRLALAEAFAQRRDWAAAIQHAEIALQLLGPQPSEAARRAAQSLQDYRQQLSPSSR